MRVHVTVTKITSLSKSPNTTTGDRHIEGKELDLYSGEAGNLAVFDNLTKTIYQTDFAFSGVDAVLAAPPTNVKLSCATATTANIVLSGEQTIDGVLTSGSRVLVKNQTTASENGIYVSAAGAWTRATDSDTGAELDDAMVKVTGGTTNSNTYWKQTTKPVTLGTSSVVWATSAPYDDHFLLT